MEARCWWSIWTAKHLLYGCLINGFLLYLQELGYMHLLNGSGAESITDERPQYGPWESCYTTWCAVTFPLKKMSRSCEEKLTSGRGLLMVSNSSFTDHFWAYDLSTAWSILFLLWLEKSHMLQILFMQPGFGGASVVESNWYISYDCYACADVSFRLHTAWSTARAHLEGNTCVCSQLFPLII